VVPILCPYDGRLAEALRRICPNVKETHDELGSLRDFKQALFVHSLPVIMEWPSYDPWFDLPSDAAPRPCAWDRPLFEEPAEGDQSEDTSWLSLLRKNAQRLLEQPPGYTENLLWDSQPVASFASECERAGQPLALGQWSDPFRNGRNWRSQTGFLETHQHDDLAEGIVQGRFLAVAFVEQVLVDQRFRVWCSLWEQYRQSGEVPVLAHEKTARERGEPVPERKTIWDYLPDVINRPCVRLYTATALHYLLPVRQGDAVEYGPVCSDGLRFDYRRLGIGEAIRNPRQADGVNWLSDDALKLFGPVEVMVDAAGSEEAVARMYGVDPTQVHVLPVVTSQAGDPLGVAFKIGQGAIFVLPECQDEEAKAMLVAKMATQLWGAVQEWLAPKPIQAAAAAQTVALQANTQNVEEVPNRLRLGPKPKVTCEEKTYRYLLDHRDRDDITCREIEKAIHYSRSRVAHTTAWKEYHKLRKKDAEQNKKRLSDNQGKDDDFVDQH
jgi:hypothetical protein